MKVSDLIKILENQDPEAEIILRCDASYPAYALVKRVIPGNWKQTSYGNDFMEYEAFLNHDEFRGVLIEAHEEEDDSLPNVYKTDLKS